jgi:hypothetical protein
MLCFDALNLRDKISAFSYKRFETNLDAHLPIGSFDILMELPAIIEEYKKNDRLDMVKILKHYIEKSRKFLID